MHKAYSSWSVAAVVLYCLAVCFPPASVILGSLMLIKPLKVTIEANEVIKNGKVFELPDWINECSRGDQKFFTENQISTEDMGRTVSHMNSL